MWRVALRGTRVAVEKLTSSLLWQLTRNLSYKREVVMEVIQIGFCMCVYFGDRLAGGLDMVE